MAIWPLEETGLAKYVGFSCPGMTTTKLGSVVSVFVVFVCFSSLSFGNSGEDGFSGEQERTSNATVMSPKIRPRPP